MVAETGDYENPRLKPGIFILEDYRSTVLISIQLDFIYRCYLFLSYIQPAKNLRNDISFCAVIYNLVNVGP